MSRFENPGLDVIAQHSGIVPHWLGPGTVVASRGYHLLESSGQGAWRRLGSVQESLGRRILSRIELASLALRLGIHALVPVASGGYLLCVNGRLARTNTDGGFDTVMRFQEFHKPAREGLMRDRKGRIFLAQYARNPQRELSMHIWRSDDDGLHFEPIHCFEPGQVRHIHFVQEDPLDGSLWMGTGDRDDESGIFRSSDGGDSWEEVGRGAQDWRAISLAFRPEAIYFGTDAGNDVHDYTNRILRLDRRTGRLDEVQRIQGPVHGVTTLADGSVLIATALEGGVNEADDRAHLWHSADGEAWREIASWQDGRQPRRVQYGVAHFVPGQSQQDTVYVVLRGLAGMSLGYLEARIRA